MEARRDFVIGLTAIGAIIALAFLLLRFGEFAGLTNPRWDLVAEMTDAGGLRSGSQVTLNGVPVGVVDRVEIRQELARPIQVHLRVDDDVSLPPATTAATQSALLGGGARLELLLPPLAGRGIGELARDGSARILGESITAFDQLGEEIDRRLAGLDRTLVAFETLAGTWNDVGERVERVFDEEDPDGIPATVASIRTTFERAESAFERADALLDDEDGLAADVRGAVARLDALLVEGERAVLAATAAAEGLRADGGRVADAVIPVAASIQDVADDLRLLVQAARDGDGTLGQLVNNPDLYRSLDDAARTLESTLRSLQSLLDAIRSQGVEIKTG